MVKTSRSLDQKAAKVLKILHKKNDEAIADKPTPQLLHLGCIPQ
jgi:hypothetical protein